MMTQSLREKADFDSLLERSHNETVLLYKHSTTCPVSARAKAEIGKLKDGQPVYTLVVQQARNLSQTVAEELGVQHETPQIIVIDKGEAVSHFSHGSITAEKMREALNG